MARSFRWVQQARSYVDRQDNTIDREGVVTLRERLQARISEIKTERAALEAEIAESTEERYGSRVAQQRRRSRLQQLKGYSPEIRAISEAQALLTRAESAVAKGQTPGEARAIKQAYNARERTEAFRDAQESRQSDERRVTVRESVSGKVFSGREQRVSGRPSFIGVRTRDPGEPREKTLNRQSEPGEPGEPRRNGPSEGFTPGLVEAQLENVAGIRSQGSTVQRKTYERGTPVIETTSMVLAETPSQAFLASGGLTAEAGSTVSRQSYELFPTVGVRARRKASQVVGGAKEKTLGALNVVSGGAVERFNPKASFTYQVEKGLKATSEGLRGRAALSPSISVRNPFKKSGVALETAPDYLDLSFAKKTGRAAAFTTGVGEKFLTGLRVKPGRTVGAAAVGAGVTILSQNPRAGAATTKLLPVLGAAYAVERVGAYQAAPTVEDREQVLGTTAQDFLGFGVGRGLAQTGSLVYDVGFRGARITGGTAPKSRGVFKRGAEGVRDTFTSLMADRTGRVGGRSARQRAGRKSKTQQRKESFNTQFNPNAKFVPSQNALVVTTRTPAMKAAGVKSATNTFSLQPYGRGRGVLTQQTYYKAVRGDIGVQDFMSTTRRGQTYQSVRREVSPRNAFVTFAKPRKSSLKIWSDIRDPRTPNQKRNALDFGTQEVIYDMGRAGQNPTQRFFDFGQSRGKVRPSRVRADSVLAQDTKTIPGFRDLRPKYEVINSPATQGQVQAAKGFRNPKIKASLYAGLRESALRQRRVALYGSNSVAAPSTGVTSIARPISTTLPSTATLSKTAPLSGQRRRQSLFSFTGFKTGVGSRVNTRFKPAQSSRSLTRTDYQFDIGRYDATPSKGFFDTGTGSGKTTRNLIPILTGGGGGYDDFFVKTPTPQSPRPPLPIIPIPPLFGGGGIKSRGRTKGVKRPKRGFRYAPDLPSIELGIKAKKAPRTPRGGFTGAEIRPLVI